MVTTQNKLSVIVSVLKSMEKKEEAPRKGKKMRERDHISIFKLYSMGGIFTIIS